MLLFLDVQCDLHLIITVDTFDENQSFFWLIVCAFAVSGVKMEGYNLLVTSTIEMAVVYRSESDSFLNISVE